LPPAPPPVALITGAAKRIGATTARYLHRCGYRIVAHYHTSANEAQALVRELNAARAESAAALAGDLADAGAATAVIAEAVRHWDRLDLLVNNASVFDRTPLAAVTPAAWDRIHAINVRAPYFLALGAGPHLARAGGSVVNIADIHAERPRRQYSAYCISKSALVAATRALALELAPGVRVNCVAPGAILWAVTEDDETRQRTLEVTPLGRQGDPEDIAAAIHYLAQAAFVTGEVINVDGGRYLGA
jgi:pteridine reductase